MKKLTTVVSMVTLSLALASCFESGSETTPPPAVAPPPVGLAKDGLTYYQSNCASCHKAGSDDTTAAFGAQDLAQSQDKIRPDMSNYDTRSTFNLMTAYNNIPAQRVADLKVYLESLPLPPKI